MSNALERDEHWGKLMAKVQQGDQQAYRTLLEELQGVIRSFVGKRIRNNSAVDDLTQEILMAIHKAKHTFDTSKNFSSWMFAIARYRLIDYIRYKKRHPEQEVASTVLPEKLNQIDTSAGTESLKLLKAALQKLPKKQRMVVTLLKLEGYPVRIVAQMLNLSESNVKVLSHRACGILQEELREVYG